MNDLDKLLEKFNNRPPSLWNVVRHQLGFSIDMCDEIVDAVEEWFRKNTIQTPTNGINVLE